MWYNLPGFIVRCNADAVQLQVDSEISTRGDNLQNVLYKRRRYIESQYGCASYAYGELA